MSYVVCHKHDTVSPWGCPICRKDGMHEAMERAIAETREKIRASFRNSNERRDGG